MKTVILCGGFGTRLSEETQLKPKPMVEVGGYPILWHIMKLYGAYGFKDFVLALGYKGHIIKDYFLQFRSRNSDVTVDVRTNEKTYENCPTDDWTVRMFDTGQATLTGGRLQRLKNQLKDEETFMFTYGDGVGNIDLDGLLRFHRSHRKIATVTAVRPPARFGSMVIDEQSSRVIEFKEKPQTGEGWINGGFFVFNSEVFSYLSGDETVLEGEPTERLASDGQLMAYRHAGFWQPMDTLRDKGSLETLWDSGQAPWKVW